MKVRKPFFETVVVGADFSRTSKRVFQNALAMAKQWKCKVVLAHAATFLDHGVYPIIGFTNSKVEEEEIEKRLRSYYKAPRNVEVRAIIQYGAASDNLVKIAKQYKKPLLLVGHTKKGAFGRWAMGSVSSSLALKSPVPVWIQ